MTDPTEGQRRTQVAELRAAGKSIRQIAELTGWAKSTIARLAALAPATADDTLDTVAEMLRDTAQTVPAAPGPADATAELTPAEEAAELRLRAESLRREACEERRQAPQVVAEAQAKAQQLSARAYQNDRLADELCRRAADLTNPGPNLPPGARIFGRVV